MPNDLTWQQVKNHRETPASTFDIGYESSGGAGIIVIRIASKEINTDDEMNSLGVILFINKFLIACNKAQVQLNQNLAAGNRLTSFPTPIYGVPKIDSDNILRSQCTQQMVSRLTVDNNSAIGISS